MKYIPPALASSVTAIARTTWCGIEFYYAKVGHGKTYHVVKNRILPALLEGRHIFTNIDFGGPLLLNSQEEILSEEKRAGFLISQFLNKDIRKFFHVVDTRWIQTTLILPGERNFFDKLPSGSRVVLDEVQNIFPVTGYKSNPQDFFSLLCKCRHFDIDFVFISQNTSLVDKRIPSTCTDFIRIKNLRFLSSFLGSRYKISHHQSERDWEGYGSSVLKFDTRIFGLYRSADSIVKHSFRKLPPFLFAPIVLIALWGLALLWKLPKSALFNKNLRQNRSQMALPAVFAPPPRYSDIPRFSISCPGPIASRFQVCG